jgi:hypothetical protein
MPPLLWLYRTEHPSSRVPAALVTPLFMGAFLTLIRVFLRRVSETSDGL